METGTLPQSAAYSSQSDSELQPFLSWLVNSVREEKDSEEKMARLRQSSETAAAATARLAGAMLRYRRDAGQRKLLWLTRDSPSDQWDESMWRNARNCISRPAPRLPIRFIQRARRWFQFDFSK